MEHFRAAWALGPNWRRCGEHQRGQLADPGHVFVPLVRALASRRRDGRPSSQEVLLGGGVPGLLPDLLDDVAHRPQGRQRAVGAPSLGSVLCLALSQVRWR